MTKRASRAATMTFLASSQLCAVKFFCDEANPFCLYPPSYPLRDDQQRPAKEATVGMLGILLLITAIEHFGLTLGGFALGAVGIVLTGLGFRFGFCPACTVACLVADRPK